jgi:hypothetical protein
MPQTHDFFYIKFDCIYFCVKLSNLLKIPLKSLFSGLDTNLFSTSFVHFILNGKGLSVLDEICSEYCDRTLQLLDNDQIH